jgi:hypothetical protein
MLLRVKGKEHNGMAKTAGLIHAHNFPTPCYLVTFENHYETYVPVADCTPIIERKEYGLSKSMPKPGDRGTDSITNREL